MQKGIGVNATNAHENTYGAQMIRCCNDKLTDYRCNDIFAVE